MAQNVELLFPKNFNGSYDVSVQSILIYPFFLTGCLIAMFLQSMDFLLLGHGHLNIFPYDLPVCYHDHGNLTKKGLLDYLHIPNPITGLYLFGFVSSFIFFLNKGVVSKVK